MRVNRFPILLTLVPLLLTGADNEPGVSRHGKVTGGRERLLQVADTGGFSIYDLNDSHKLPRKAAVPDTAEYKGTDCASSRGTTWKSPVSS